MNEGTPRLWIVDPSLHHPEQQGVEEVLSGWAGESRIFRPGLEPGSGPGPGLTYDTDGVVILGSAASVYDSLAWIDRLGTWLKPLVQGQVSVPLLGICFGHQLIAHLAGGAVRYLRDDRSKTVGVETSHLQDSRLLPGNHALRVIVSHREQVGQAPSGFRVAARRGTGCLDGLEHEELDIFTFQFHPEARDEFALWTGIDPSLVDIRMREDGQRLLGSFRDWVRARAMNKKRAGGDPPALNWTSVEGDEPMSRNQC